MANSAPQGVVSFGTMLDIDYVRRSRMGAPTDFKYANAPKEDQIYLVRVHDLVFSVPSNRRVNMPGMRTKMYLHGTAAFNGILKDTKPRFLGVAVTSASVGHNSMFTTQVCGTNTIVNTGTNMIHAGDIVVWDLPDVSSPNLKEGRVLPVLKTARSIPDANDYRMKVQDQLVGKAISSAGPGEAFLVLLLVSH